MKKGEMTCNKFNQTNTTIIIKEIGKDAETCFKNAKSSFTLENYTSFY